MKNIPVINVVIKNDIRKPQSAAKIEAVIKNNTLRMLLNSSF